MPDEDKVEKVEDRQEREPIDETTDKVTYYGDDGQGNEMVVCVSYEPNEAEAAKHAAVLEEEKARDEKTAAGVEVLEQQQKPGKNPTAAELTAALVDVVRGLEERVAKLEGR
jgi:hypothetical protein